MQILLFFILVLLIAVVWLSVMLWQERKKDPADAESSCEAEGETTKAVHMDKIMSLFETDAELTNTEIREALGVSSRTVVRYMDELEKTGQVIQTRVTGVAVTYRRK